MGPGSGRAVVLTATLCAAATPACFASHSPADPANRPDAGPALWAEPPQGVDGGAGPVSPPRRRDGGACDPRTARLATASLDLLFVVDDSPSMEREQEQLARRMPEVIRVLASGDLDGDGEVDTPPVRDLHVSVVTTDMGVLGNAVDGCEEPHFGDDGRMGRAGDPACRSVLPAFLTLDPSSRAEVEELAGDFACLARVGADGCGFEQPLEAALKALTPADAPVRFHDDTGGHGDGANGGFVRDDTVLAVVIVTDEDDCSASDPELFNGDSYVYPEAMALRCAYERRALHPIERFVRGLTALRPEHPERLFVGALAGVPRDHAVAGSGAEGYEAILDDPRMQHRRREEGTDLEPSCVSEEGGEAQPPRRIVRLLSELAPRSAVASICDDGLTAPLETLLEGLARTLREAACEAAPEGARAALIDQRRRRGRVSFPSGTTPPPPSPSASAQVPPPRLHDRSPSFSQLPSPLQARGSRPATSCTRTHRPHRTARTVMATTYCTLDDRCTTRAGGSRG